MIFMHGPVSVPMHVGASGLRSAGTCKRRGSPLTRRGEQHAWQARCFVHVEERRQPHQGLIRREDSPDRATTPPQLWASRDTRAAKGKASKNAGDTRAAKGQASMNAGEVKTQHGHTCVTTFLCSAMWPLVVAPLPVVQGEVSRPSGPNHNRRLSPSESNVQSTK